ncbi:hypothetical protein D3C78_1905320 [compost metagenome]
MYLSDQLACNNDISGSDVRSDNGRLANNDEIGADNATVYNAFNSYGGVTMKRTCKGRAIGQD